LGYLASEVHPSIGGLFNANIGEEVKQYLRGNTYKKLAYIDAHLLNGGKRFLVGDSFTIVDSYLYIILTWTTDVGIDVSTFKNISSYFEGISSLDIVKEGHARIATSPSSTL
jgi:glutathione S-transferase